MFFWWICGGESGLPILFLLHLRTALRLFSNNRNSTQISITIQAEINLGAWTTLSRLSSSSCFDCAFSHWLYWMDFRFHEVACTSSKIIFSCAQMQRKRISISFSVWESYLSLALPGSYLIFERITVTKETCNALISPLQSHLPPP